MIVITDSNIIFSALISPKGTVAKILKERSKIQFLAPDFLLEEVKEHWAKIEKYSSLNKKELKTEFQNLHNKINFIKTTEIPNKIIFEAFEIAKNIDDEDTFFVALHFYKKHKLWTSDKELIKGLLKKGYDICITTEELQERLYK